MTELLIEADWLQARLADSDLRVFDCTTHMIAQPVGASKIVSGLRDYESGHIPGAMHLDMVKDLSDPQGSYPFTMLSPEQFEAVMQRLGVKETDHVVLYGRSAMSTITRAWTVFHVNGHDKVSVLNGGWAAWLDLNEPSAVCTDTPQYPRSKYRVSSPKPQHIVDMEAVKAVAEQAPGRLVNALTREQFKGAGGAHYGRPGRIPGSLNVPARELFDPANNRFASAWHMRGLFEAAGVDFSELIVHYCGGGIAASTSAFAQALLGHQNWAIYDDSLLQWSDQPDTPMEVG